jgi:hypothetical protein
LGSTGRARADEEVSFNRDIRPILSANCFACHGFDAKQRKADLRLDTREGATQLRDGTAAVHPGDPEGSELWRRVSSSDPDLVMPPPDSKKQLSPREKDLLRRWIAQGAIYQKHWAFEPPRSPTVPERVEGFASDHPIDRFLDRQLQREGLPANGEASRETLIRRVAFALTGLPPTIEEVREFLADGSPVAYDQMVERYLKSPHYGEEMARHWLDFARYADTHGLHLDNERTMWAYRDWVVRAFNRNQPFDSFTVEQLAGDLLPDPTQDQKIATGFNRCNVSTGEGGSIDAEFLYRYAVERTTTMIQVWMGLTGGCAVCHDHKYDPLTQREFYSLYAFFNSAADPAMDGNIRNTRPYMPVPTPEQSQELETAEQHEAMAKQALKAAVESAEFADPAAVDPPPGTQPVVIDLLDDDFPFGSRPRNTSRNEAVWADQPVFGAKSGRRALGLASSGEYEVSVAFATIPVVVPRDARLEFWIYIEPNYTAESLRVQLDGGKVNRRFVWGSSSEKSGEATTTVAAGRLPPEGEWTLLALPLPADDYPEGTRVKSLTVAQKGGRVWIDGVRLIGEQAPSADPRASFNAFWKQGSGSDPQGIDADLRQLYLDGPDKPHEAEAEQRLRRFFLEQVQHLELSPVRMARERWTTARIAKLAVEDAIAGTIVFRELETPREAFVMLRGQYDKPGDRVEPGVPEVLPPLRIDAGRRPTRLDLAGWLLADNHPLTSRVVVNRFWQQFFGTGLVRTSDDFGAQGELPSHPELLDWLAVRYRQSGWNTLELVRLIVTSAAFRRDARISDLQQQRDPANRLLARGPRLRLDAEQIRDNALFVSGLLDLRMGGRGALPYQPPNIWEPVGYSDSNTRFYQVDSGPALYRRSIYCFLKRTAPPPFMSNFDAPNREQFCARRERSNTPLQALQLLNDTQHFEAARALGQRAMREGGATPDQRIDTMLRMTLGRPPTAREADILKSALARFQQRYNDAPEEARAAIHFGASRPEADLDPRELAAYTLLGNLVLNLDETITRP